MRTFTNGLTLSCLVLLALVTLLTQLTPGRCQAGARRRTRRPRRQRTTPAPVVDDDFDAVVFLEKVGYLDSQPSRGSHSEQSVNNAVTEFQRFVGLPVTGVPDRRTVQKMMAPRCGVADVLTPSQRPLGLRDSSDVNVPLAFNAPGHKWNNNDVSYKFVSYTRQLGGTAQQNAIRNAFQKWSAVTPLRFLKRTSGSADIEIGFGRREHGDGAASAFDGRGRTLAHAYFPGLQAIAGDTHFDDDEEWTLGTTQGTNLEIVAAHEFGHALGLGHSSDPRALMAPYYQGYDPDWTLQDDDIRGIQSLYGRGSGGGSVTRAPTRRTPRPTSRPRLTRPPRRTLRPTRPTQRPTRPTRPTRAPPTTRTYCGMRFDAIAQVHDGNIFAFKGRYLYLVGRSGIYDRRSISDVFPGAPGGLGAVVYDRYRRKLYMFKGRRLYRFTGYNLDSGYPRRLPRDFFFVRAAWQWVNGAIYVFQGRDKYAHWSESLTSFSRGFPQTVRSKWEGMPINIDSAFRGRDGYYYMFKGTRYWKYSSRSRLSSGFPKDSGPVFLNCHASQGQRAGPQRLLSDSDFSFLTPITLGGN